jgi:hypothetical protein
MTIMITDVQTHKLTEGSFTHADGKFEGWYHPSILSISTGFFPMLPWVSASAHNIVHQSIQARHMNGWWAVKMIQWLQPHWLSRLSGHCSCPKLHCSCPS